MKDVIRDESFENLEELLIQNKERLHYEMNQKHQKILDIEAFIRYGREGSKE